MKVYQKISNLISAIQTVENTEWENKHTDNLERIIKEYLPSGSGFDGDCLLEDDSTPERLNFKHDYHCMDEHGGYDGWIELHFIIIASLQHGFKMRINWHSYNSKYKINQDYFYVLWNDALNTEID